ncbi:MAG: LamG domain-containing protein, partial [Lentisphaerales bacterium]
MIRPGRFADCRSFFCGNRGWNLSILNTSSLKEDVMRHNRSRVDVCDASAARRLKAACLALAFLFVGASAVFAQDIDDDGYTDVQELNPYILCPPVTGRMITSPIYSRSPLIQRSIALSGAAIAVPNGVPNRFLNVPDWTIECWINPATATQTGTLIEHTVTATGRDNFVLGLANGIPYVAFDNIAGTIRYTAGGNPLWDVPIPANKWTHLAGVFDPANDTLELFVNGVSYRAQWTPATFDPIGRCAVGAGVARLGVGVSGFIDEVRIWTAARTEDQIAGGKDLFGAGVLDVVPDGADLVAYFPFDDGGFTAEDYINRLDWAYDLTPVTFTTNRFVNVSGDLDVDGDEIPDWWEDMFFAGNADPDLDTDGDGLTNIQEYELGTNPKAQDTDNDGLRDGNEDNDGDGLPNSREITLGTDPLDPDTDDDGLSDKQEVDQNLDPTDSIHPYVMRYIHNDGNGWISVPAYVEGEDDNGSRFDLDAWTVEAVVRLDEVPTSDVVLVRRTAEPGYVTFEIGVGSNMLPYARFESDLGEEYKVEGFVHIETNEWVFLGGKYGAAAREDHGQLAVFQNGTRAVRDTTDILPALGPQQGDVIIASNLVGDIDEVRIWQTAIADEEIRLRMWKSLMFGTDIAEMGALDLNGEGRMTRLNTADPGILATWTIEAWVKSTTPGVVIAREAQRADDDEILYNYNLGISPGGVPYALFDVNDYLYVFDPAPHHSAYWRWGTAILSGGTVVTDGEWHHLAFSFDGNLALLFVDGVAEATFTLANSTGATYSWHLLPDETFEKFYYAVPAHIRATAAGNLVVGEGLNGLIDEARIFNVARSQQAIQDSMYTKAPAAGLVSYFDFDDVELIDDIRVPDALNKTSRGLAGVMAEGATLTSDMGDNAPLQISPLEVIAPKMAAYLPFDDGRWTNRVGSASTVEDILYAGELGYSGGLMPSTANIDYALYSSTNVFYPGNPYAGNEGALRYPASFFIPYDMPWRIDADADDMPDIYEQYYWFDPNRSESPDNRDIMSLADFDGDGLKNLHEYYSGTDPTFHDSDGDGMDDGDEDSDGDGVPNRDEQALGLHAGRIDTDDDGFTDEEEALV